MGRHTVRGAAAGAGGHGQQLFRAPVTPAFLLGLLAASAVAALALWWPSFTDVVLDRDEGVYATVAREWAAGRLPYRDVFDHKPPAIYLIYRSVFALFGASMAPVRVAFALMTALTGLAAALVLRAARPESSRAALAAVAFSVVYLQASAATWGGTANTEVPMMLCVAAAALAALRSRASRHPGWLAALGLASAAALLVKPVCMPEVALFLAIAVCGGRRLPPDRRALAAGLASYVAAAAVPMLLAVTYFAVRGGLPAALEAVVAYNVAYAGAPPVPASVRVPYLAGEVARGFAPFLAGGAALAAAAMRGCRGTVAWLAALWSLASAAGVLAAGRPYLHYLQQLTVPLALAGAAGLASLRETLAAGARRRLSVAAGVLMPLLFVPSVSATVEQMRVWASAPTWEAELGRWIAEQVAPGRTIFVWGASAQIYFHAGRRPASRLVYTYPLAGGSPFARRSREEVAGALLAAPPAAIVVVRGDRTGEAERAPDEEWAADWVPALRPLLAGYTRSVTEPCILYLCR
jgi:hypothetical protein